MTGSASSSRRSRRATSRSGSRFSRRRYRVVPASEVLGEARACRRGAPIPIALTFDDDLYSHLDVIAPILLRRGFPATFFVGPPLPPGAAFWWEDLQALADEVRLPSHLDSLPRDGPDARGTTRAARDPRPRPGDRVSASGPAATPSQPSSHALAGMNTRRRLDAEAMVSLVEAGFELGFHTRHHYLLTTLDDERLTRELTDGRGILETIAKSPIAVMAYPHGKADTRVAQAARAARLRHCVHRRQRACGHGDRPAARPKDRGAQRPAR